MDPSRHYRIFVSSVQKEFAEERQALKTYVVGDALLKRFFSIFLFEDLPASDRRADEIYLAEVDNCDLYIGLFGNDYGYEDAESISPTEREFIRATQAGKTRLIFIKGTNDAARHPKMQQLIRTAGDQLIRRRFGSTEELTAQVYASLVDFLQERGVIRNRPFDDTVCFDATLTDIDNNAVTTFIRRANALRQFPFDQNTPVGEVLTHLGLLRENLPTNAALLLFGRNPQQFIPCAEVRCMHFHGTEIVRPAPYYQIFKGPLFLQVDQAANFVLSVTNISVGTRALSAQAPVSHEIPPDVIREAVVNAIAHRDYTSGAAIQVSVFADRVEVWNPGELQPPLTPESLRHPHRSVARNHRICESLFLAGYIEKYGTGTLMMIRESLSHALPEPRFQQRGGEFSAIIGRDWLTEKILAELHLNDRQIKAVGFLKSAGKITNQEYQQVALTTDRTAARDLDELVEKGVCTRIGKTGRSASYTIARKHDINTPNTTSSSFAKDSGGVKMSELIKNQILTKQAKVRAGTKLGLGRDQVGTKSTDPVRRLLHALSAKEMTSTQLRFNLHIKHRPTFRATYLHPALKSGLVEMTIPDKPNSRLQKYRLTKKGRAWLAGKTQDR